MDTLRLYYPTHISIAGIPFWDTAPLRQTADIRKFLSLEAKTHE
jgi:hypothetical protein